MYVWGSLSVALAQTKLASDSEPSYFDFQNSRITYILMSICVLASVFTKVITCEKKKTL